MNDATDGSDAASAALTMSFSPFLLFEDDEGAAFLVWNRREG